MLVLCCASSIGRVVSSSVVVHKASYGSSSSKDSIDKCESKETWTGSQDHLVLHLLLQHAAIIALKES